VYLVFQDFRYSQADAPFYWVWPTRVLWGNFKVRLHTMFQITWAFRRSTSPKTRCSVLEVASPRRWGKGARYDLGPSNAGSTFLQFSTRRVGSPSILASLLTGPPGATQISCYLGLLPACFNVYAKRHCYTS
jgi:hypothetical protein